MPLRLTPTNLLQFYTFLSPILISCFLLFMGFYNGTPQGIIYLFRYIYKSFCRYGI